MKTWTYLGILLTFLSQCQSLNILCIFPYEGKSHFFVFRAYIQELVQRGHNVTVISHFPEKMSSPNYHDISLAGPSETILRYETIRDDFPLEKSFLTVHRSALFLLKFGIENCDNLLENKEVQQLWNSKPTFDVIIFEQFISDCALGLAHKIGGPVIGLTSHVFMPWQYDRFGIPYNPSFVSFHFTEGGTKPTLYQRVERIFLNTYFNLVSKYVQMRNQNSLAKYFDDVPPLEQLAKDIKVLLLYTHFTTMGSRLFPANVIEVGGFHVGKPKSLPPDLKEFMDQAKNGVIYISFGSLIKTSTIANDKFDAIIGALSEIPQKIIWKFENKTMLEQYKNIYSSSWIPQNEVLAHPKTLVFFSHCGNLGTTEALHHGVPLVAMPIFGDQLSNAATMEESGLGVQIQYADLTKENLLSKLKTVLDSKFRDQVKELSRIWHDRPTTAMDTAIFWTEFVARHKNITVLKTASVDVPLYQYFYLDIIAIFIVVFAIALIVTIKILTFCCASKSNKGSRTKKKPKKK